MQNTPNKQAPAQHIFPRVGHVFHFWGLWCSTIGYETPKVEHL